jgi:hypothetical protein
LAALGQTAQASRTKILPSQKRECRWNRAAEYKREKKPSRQSFSLLVAPLTVGLLLPLVVPCRLPPVVLIPTGLLLELPPAASRPHRYYSTHLLPSLSGGWPPARLHQLAAALLCSAAGSHVPCLPLFSCCCLLYSLPPLFSVL